ncbi:universal stress protein [Primorskyibacter sedentarius]|uniref:Nucleotide-binding universal stress UspA family protein n=1 Tax=Primorskyibacter sedentarius TaxID=745311 RepID=A0A4R3JJC4_9RHOB|nr:universal stress protein [Primorskyibacter sedentarius]TCS66239.1 nucleotide-binding universal stress UspA family protein [Primorskyibacter sedentarius]
MSGKFVVAYDGSPASKRALDFAAERAVANDATLVVTHVLEWSPYSFLTPTEIEERHKRRTDELERAEKALMAPVVAELSDKGVKNETVIKYGHIADTLCKVVKDTGATQMFVGRDGQGAFSARVFGSVAGSLVQIAPVPCTIVP